MGKEIFYTKAFSKEFGNFPREIQDDILVLIEKYLNGIRLPHTGNWRAISCLVSKDYLTFVYAFHKKSQKLLEKDKTVIVKRIKGVLK